MDAMVPELIIQSEEPALLPTYAAEAKRQKDINRSYPYVATQGYVLYLTGAISTLDTSSTAQSLFTSCSQSFHTPFELDEHTETSDTVQILYHDGGDAYITLRFIPPCTFSLGD